MGNNHKMKKFTCKYKTSRYAQIGVVSFGSDCPSQGVYARVTKIKHWIQFIAGGALDTKCNQEIPCNEMQTRNEFPRCLMDVSEVIQIE